MTLNIRQRTLIVIGISSSLILTVVIGGLLLGEERIATELTNRNQAPAWRYPFGTDWLGRDMLTRTLKGLTLSLGVGLLAAGASAVIALFLGVCSATLGRTVDAIIKWLIDLFLSVPHLVTLILMSFALGGGFKGIVVGIALTHWPRLARVIRSEVLQLRSQPYVEASRQFGKSRLWIMRYHFLPHLMPQLIVGLVLMFPHAIMHEAAVTFLGFGLSPHEPAIGIILSESMRYLSTGMWWLAFFPGLLLVIVVRSFDVLGDHLSKLIDPTHAHR